MTTEYTVEKFTDLAVSGLATGGKLQDDQSDTFVRKVFDRPGLVADVRRVPMKSDTMNINKVALANDIVYAAPAGTPPYAADDGSNSRYLAAANRFSPTFEQVQLVSKEYIAEIHITDDVMENNLEQEDIAGLVRDMAAARISLEMEKHFLLGDTAGVGGVYANSAYTLQDGILKRVTTHVVDHANAAVNLQLFANMQLALPTEFAPYLGNYKYYLHNYKELNWRVGLAARATALGDKLVTGEPTTPALGAPIAPVATIPQTNSLFTDPKNLIIGFQRDIRLETQRDPRARSTAFIWTYKAAFQIEEETAVIKATNVG